MLSPTVVPSRKFLNSQYVREVVPQALEKGGANQTEQEPTGIKVGEVGKVGRRASEDCSAR